MVFSIDDLARHGLRNGFLELSADQVFEGYLLVCFVTYLVADFCRDIQLWNRDGPGTDASDAHRQRLARGGRQKSVEIGSRSGEARDLNALGLEEGAAKGQADILERQRLGVLGKGGAPEGNLYGTDLNGVARKIAEDVDLYLRDCESREKDKSADDDLTNAIHAASPEINPPVVTPGG